ncbi:MAG: hypothetical protein HY360_26355 [Verrucomicrobia bacterium]|nr:hypothetical protein [Verrucomicrobiota bacterium]
MANLLGFEAQADNDYRYVRRDGTIIRLLGQDVSDDDLERLKEALPQVEIIAYKNY